METDSVQNAAAEVAGAGGAFKGAWTQGSSGVTGLLGGLGKGPMGQVFLAKFRPGLQQVTDIGKQVSGRLLGTASAARGSAADYTARDAGAGARLPR